MWPAARCVPGCDVRVGCTSAENGGVESGKILKESAHVVTVTLEVICSLTRNTNLVLAAELEAAGLFCDLGEQPESFFLWHGGVVVSDYASECVDLACDRSHWCGENGVELAKVCKVPGEI